MGNDGLLENAHYLSVMIESVRGVEMSMSGCRVYKDIERKRGRSDEMNSERN